MSFLSKLRRAMKRGAAQAPAEPYVRLREMVFNVKPEDLHVKLSGPDEVWGLLMETGYDRGHVSTLVALGEGTVSLYFSHGAAFIGCGTHAGPRQAAQAFLAASREFVAQAQPAMAHPVPAQGHVRFYFLSGHQILTTQAQEAQLRNHRHVFSPLFFQGHAVISEIRKLDESRGIKESNLASTDGREGHA